MKSRRGELSPLSCRSGIAPRWIGVQVEFEEVSVRSRFRRSEKWNRELRLRRPHHPRARSAGEAVFLRRPPRFGKGGNGKKVHHSAPEPLASVYGKHLPGDVA